MDKKKWKRVRPITSPTFSAKKMRMVSDIPSRNGSRKKVYNFTYFYNFLLHTYRWCLLLRKAVIHWMRYLMTFLLKAIVLNYLGDHQTTQINDIIIIFQCTGYLVSLLWRLFWQLLLVVK